MTMNTTQPSANTEPQQNTVKTRRPDEKAGFDISGVVTIYDPETKEVFVKVRT